MQGRQDTDVNKNQNPGSAKMDREVDRDFSENPGPKMKILSSRDLNPGFHNVKASKQSNSAPGPR